MAGDSEHPETAAATTATLEDLSAAPTQSRTISSGATPGRPIGSVVAQRYRLLERIGRGGLGSVYRAADETRGATVALKLLRSGDGRRRQHARPLFEREYHTLRQLAHPSVIEVYDYGLDGEQPYYTMELLSGQDLRELAPMPWREVCELLMPVASSLAVLHSRRLLHRDVSARNVRRTADGRAKLLDFGAMGAMGVAQSVMGTAPYVPPEALHGQPLDARSDLYAFGALLYLMLTGRHAYAARHLGGLRDSWRSPVPSPRARVPEVPEDLSNLVMNLLSLDPGGRLSTAGEVMAWLGGIAELTLQEDPAVHRAYLTTPGLVARDAQLSRLRELLVRARRGHGMSLYLEAPAGAGRTRLLDACMLEAQLAGALVARVGMGDAQAGDHSAVHALVRQLREAAPNLPSAPGLCDGEPSRPRLQSALRDWFLSVARQRVLVLLVDDYHGLDEASAALLAALADTTAERQLVLVVTAPAGASHAAAMAWEVLTRRAQPLALEPLDATQCESLLISIFGDVPNVRLVSARLHAASGGNPRALMELAEQLVDAGVVRYEAGSWVLPASLQEMTPERIVEQVRARVKALSPPARRLAHVLALAPDLAFDHDECSSLCASSGGELFATLDELAQAQIVTGVGTSLRLAHDGYRRALQGDGEERRLAHGRLAQVLQRRQSLSHAAVHFMAAGEPALAVALLVRVAERGLSSGAPAEASLALRASDAYRQTLAAAVEATERPRERLLLRMLIVEMGVHATPALLKAHLPALLEQLRSDCGLADYGQLQGEGRMQRAMAAASARFEAAEPDARVLSPAQAIPLLSRVCLATGQSAVRWFDHEIIDMLPSLQPLIPLAPALWVSQQLVTAYGDVVAGRFVDCFECYGSVLSRLAQPDRGGLDAAAHARAELGARAGLALVVASWGQPDALAHAAKLDAVPEGRVLACHVRTIYHLVRGGMERAEHWQQQAELLEIQHAPTELTARRHIYPQISASIYAEDLLAVKQLLAGVHEMAERAEGWHVIERFATASYDHIRGDREAALRGYQQALALADPGRHPAWPLIAEQHLSVLVELGRVDEALRLGAPALEACKRERLPTYLVKPLAIAHALRGEHGAAVALADQDVQRWEAHRGTGQYIGRGYETRARVAILAGDRAGFETYARLCAEHFLAGTRASLRAKYEALLQEAITHGLAAPPAPPVDADLDEEETLLRHMLEGCRDAKERAEAVLRLLLERVNVDSGVLFGRGEDGPQLLASQGRTPEAMAPFMQSFFVTEPDDGATVTMSLDETEDPDVFRGEHGDYHPIVLRLPDGHYETAIAVAMVGCPVRPRHLGARFLRALASALLDAVDTQCFAAVR